MTKVISVVPNVSEGRDMAFVQSVQSQLEKVPGLIVMAVAMDQARNRTNFSFTGDKEAIFEGGFIVYENAIQKIDMRQHEGAYPRIGSVDIVPFVAIGEASLDEAIDWANEFAVEVGSRFSLPVYLAGEAAKNPLRRELESIREGEYEGFAAKMQDPAWKPDFGTTEFPVDRGATMVSARLPLVNLKLYLTTNNEEAARWVSNALSGISKGFPDVCLYPGLDHTCNLAVISVTIRNHSATPIYRVIEAIKTELARFGSGVSSVKTVGLMPQNALINSALHYLHITGFSEDEVLETRMDRLFR